MTSYNRRPARVRKAIRAAISTSLRRDQRCHWCDRPLKATTDPSNLAATRDHIVPVSKGGRKWVWSCRACNEIKGDMSPEKWDEFRSSNPQWWKWRKTR